MDQLEQPGNVSVARTSTLQLNQRLNNTPLRVLSEDDWRFWKENGYVVVHDAVPQGNLDAVIDLLWEFQEMDRHHSGTWYHNPAREIRMVELKNSGMVEVYNHQALWNNRQYPRVYDAFVDIWGTEKLWATIDRANLNVPIRPGHEFKGFIHWDIDTSRDPLPVNVQGVLSLNDTTAETGGFQCVPGLFRQFSEWVQTQPADRDPFKPDVSGFDIVKVETKAGDLLIWDSMLAHGIRPNRSDRPRLAQYISMTPAQEDNEQLRAWRIASWRDRVAPEGYPFPGDPRNWEQTRYGQAELSELGEKLLGLRRW
ncbi:MAG TPA: phytanoyl-CoA dioxygenase family protein [Rhodothermales bacterium]|nr:phytanoyl-CoA dioxygenase family protein [Rhodothermales bacterium]